MRRWDLEEVVEDAFVRLFRSRLSAKWMTVPALYGGKLTFPAVVVRCHATGKTDSRAPFDVNRTCSVAVEIYVEDAPEFDGDAQLQNARDVNRECRAEVIGVLATDALHVDLNAASNGEVVFGMADFVRTERGVDGNNRLLVTSAAVDLVACATEK